VTPARGIKALQVGIVACGGEACLAASLVRDEGDGRGEASLAPTRQLEHLSRLNGPHAGYFNSPAPRSDTFTT
jgi:hypothetical protein